MRYAIALSLAAAAGAGSVAWPKLAPGAALILLVTVLSLPKVEGARRWVGRGVIAAATVATLLGFYVFVRDEGMRGIVAGGRRATESTGVGRLREILAAQDVARQRATIDPDGDGVGSALFLEELTGAPLRHGARAGAPLIDPRRFPTRQTTSMGLAHGAGAFLYLVCLPRAGGGWTTRADAPVDDEFAERRYVAYAWPADDTSTMNDAFFLDEREAILVLRHAGASTPRYLGTRAPACDAALTEPDWRPWRNKAPRSRLPGAEG